MKEQEVLADAAISALAQSEHAEVKWCAHTQVALSATSVIPAAPVLVQIYIISGGGGGCSCIFGVSHSS